MTRLASLSSARRRSGITLTEILIAILILAVGIASLATLFPIGLLRLRDATRYSRSTYLVQAAVADINSRSLLSNGSFQITPYYATTTSAYNPFIQDTPYPYGSDWAAGTSGDYAGPGAFAGYGGLGTYTTSVAYATGSMVGTVFTPNASYPAINGPGLPFAYDPLWRYITVDPSTGSQGYFPGATYEARFGEGIHNIQMQGKDFASAYGLQRLTNFTPAMPTVGAIPAIFVSPEDVVWQESATQNYLMAGNSVSGLNNTPAVGPSPSTVIPDLSINPYQQINDFHYSWMFTGALANASNTSCFDGNIVVFENRPFGISTATAADGTTTYQVDGETVVEGIFGYGANLNSGNYAQNADRTVLLRWYASQPDPVVKPGDWIADITYERNQAIVLSRWWNGTPNNRPYGINNPTNNNEWDNLPAQRCFWYQVQKVVAANADPDLGNTYRSMVVYVNQALQSRTVLASKGTPSVVNAALIVPSVVNVIPVTIFTR